MTEFHLLRPWWLLALVPALLLFWYGRHKHKTQTGWHHVLPDHLAHLLIDSQPSRQSTRLWHGLLLAWLLAILALSGPTWQKLPQPLFEVNSGKVVVLDMSLSMYATDMAPNRLTRARFKTVDLLRQLPEGETGLVAFAGDGFIISPLTTDINNLLNLLPALSPEIMPAYGSEAQYGIEKAIELLEKAGYQQGDIFLITDGVNAKQQMEIQDLLGNRDYRLSVLAVGSDKPAPIKLPNGQLLKDNNGNIVLPKVDRQVLSQLADQHGGIYRDLSADDSDIRALSNQVPLDRQGQQSTDQYGDAWHEAGPWLLLLMLPFASLAFRRGLLAVTAALLISTGIPQPAMAAEQAPPTGTEATPDWREDLRQGWNSLWRTGDQRGAEHFANQDFEQAAGTFKDSQWQGAAHYRNGDYQKALEAYQQQDDARGLYNQGNALAQLGRYDDAIEQYREALTQQPGLEDAQKNIELLEKLKQQPEQQQSQDGQQGDQSQQDQQQQSGEDQQSGEQSDQQQQQDQSQQSQDSEQSDESEQQSGSDQQSPSSQDEQQQQEQQQQQSADGEQNEQEQQPEQQQQAPEQQGEQTPQGQQSQGHFEQQDLSPEERQRLNQLMKKIPDDPSLLLRNKMLLEAQKRRRQGVITKEKQNW